ncbi:hypothetical protein BFJ69_g58 [Fusarium oxysporum]|uniref:Uncharacterized protein n=1 Tax=Fusarium oxysporum TaxID=5507 RepID=A0A420P6Q7_FUSOX|nr:hypothetical protein BFJ69_g58 [Fusarium oxysporum]
MVSFDARQPGDNCCDGQDGRRPMRPESTMIDNAPYGIISI